MRRAPRACEPQPGGGGTWRAHHRRDVIDVGDHNRAVVVGEPSRQLLRDGVLARRNRPGEHHKVCHDTDSNVGRYMQALRGVTHRRGGYRDPESQAFIESWFGQFKKRCAWRAEWETIDQARKEIADYIDTYHHRPHSGIGYRTPREVAATWRPDPELQTAAT